MTNEDTDYQNAAAKYIKQKQGEERHLQQQGDESSLASALVK